MTKVSKLKIIAYFIRPYPHYLIGIVALTLLYALFEGLGIVFFFSILSSVFVTADVGQAVSLGVFNHIIKIVNIIPVTDKFIAASMLLLLSVYLKNIFEYSQRALSAYAGYKIWEGMQKKVFWKIITADYQYYLDHKQGEIIYRTLTVPCVIGSLFNLLPQAIAEGAKVLAISTILFSISFPATIAVIILGLGYYYFARYVAKNISYNLGTGRVIAGERQNILVSEAISGIRQIKVFRSERNWTNDYFRAMRDYFKLAFRDSLWLPVPKHALETTALTSLVLMVIIIKIIYPASFLSYLAVLGSFAYAFQRFMPSLNILGSLWIQIMGLMPMVEVLYSVNNERMQYIMDGDRKIDSFKSLLKFENVSFSYPNRSEVLKDISLIFEKGKTTAIVGPSGVGKSTLVDLIVRIFEPTSGKITVDGVNLKECKIETWLSKIGFVSQDTFIFNASIANNIAFNSEDAELSEIIKAAKEANAHDFIAMLPKGYETVVGDRGMKLSGGQRQRIAIARAIFRKPEILILDEATSSLDNVSEALIQDTISKISKDHTVIVIAHRLSTIRNADKIVVLNEGRITDEGTHDELMQRSWVYSLLYSRERESSEQLLIPLLEGS
jgi:ABC-type multidrug transport system fused ATPase/permease subunit